MRTLKYLLAIIIVAVLFLDAPTHAQSVINQLQEAYQKMTKGDLDGAIQVYEGIIVNTEADRQCLARAYYRLGECYLKKGDKDKAAKHFEYLISNFPKQGSSVAKAKTKLEKIRTESVGKQRVKSKRGLLKGAPTVVSTTPDLFANDVSPRLTKITFTFDRSMKDGNWSWTEFDEGTYPQVVGRPFYDRRRRTCTQRVNLKPGTAYIVAINYDPFEFEKPKSALGDIGLSGGFISASGKKARPYALVFATKDPNGKPTPIPQKMLARAKAINSGIRKGTNSTKSKPVISGHELFHDEGYKEDKIQFMGADEHYVQFKMPEKYNYVKAVRFQGRIRDAKGDSKFNIMICDEKFMPIKIFQFQVSDITYESGFAGWITLEIQPTKVPKDFAIGVTSEKIIAIGADSESSGNSFFGIPNKKVYPFTGGGDWLIRSVVSQSPLSPVTTKRETTKPKFEKPEFEWPDVGFGSEYGPEETVKLKIISVTDDAIEDAIKEKLKEMTDGSGYSLMCKRKDNTLNVKLSPVKDVEAFAKKIHFGTVVETKGRELVVEAKKNWSDEDFRFGDEPERTVRLKIIGVTDEAVENAIKEKLKKMTDGSGLSLSWSGFGDKRTAELSPVKDVKAFIKKIDFGTVTNVRGRRIVVEVDKTNDSN